MATRTELISDVSVALMAVTVLAAAAMNFAGQRTTAASNPSPRRAAAPLWNPGDQFPAPANISVRAHNRTLLLFVRSTCGFCTKSMPLYKRLIEVPLTDPTVQVIAVSTEPVSTMEAYFSGHGLSLPRAVSIQAALLRDLRVMGTPTLILLDQRSQVLQYWRGMIPASEEEAVLQTVRGQRVQTGP